LTENKIIGGINARRGQIPYQLYLYIRDDGKTLSCGAVLTELLGIQFALTAAHCLVKNRFDSLDPESVVMIAGQYKISENSKDEQIRPISHIYLHEQYDDYFVDKWWYDIAIIFYSRPFTINSKVDTIELPGYKWETPRKF